MEYVHGSKQGQVSKRTLWNMSMALNKDKVSREINGTCLWIKTRTGGGGGGGTSVGKDLHGEAVILGVIHKK